MSEPKTTAGIGLNDLAAMPRQCAWCGMIHRPPCPWVAAIEYFPDGTVKRVEFRGPPPPKQEPLGEPFSTVLYDNLWNLYVRS